MQHSDQDHNQVFYIQDSTIKSQSIVLDENYEPQIIQKYQKLNISIDNIHNQVFLKLETQYYELVIVQTLKKVGNSKEQEKQWTIKRRYSDFQWLYQSLCMSFPGHILPYFPAKSIESFFIQKLNINLNFLNSSLNKQQEIEKRKRELETFIIELEKVDKYKNSRQFGIFLQQSQDEFRRLKKTFTVHLDESYSDQSKNITITSIFQRSMAWFLQTNQKSQIPINIENITQWKKIQQDIKKWILIVTSILQKIERLIELKIQEKEWKGPDTEIDSIEKLKTKVRSSHQFNDLFIIDLKNQLVPILQPLTKHLHQISSQLDQRENLVKILIYLRRSNGSQHRIKKLLRKKQQFQMNLCSQWQGEIEKIKLNINVVKKQFQSIWRSYNERMRKIWK